jgi:hypothetical protein
MERTIGRSAGKRNRAIEMVKNGVVCHSMGHHAACSDEGVMGKMEWFATQWVIMQPARMRASWDWASKYSISQFWAGVIAVIGGNSSSSTPMNLVRNSAVVLGIISQLNATTPCPIGAIPEVLSPW